MPKTIDRTILEAALVGYQAELQKIQEKIAAIRKQLGVRVNIPVLTLAVSDGFRPKRQMSAEAKRRIAEAQKKRWRKFHAKQKGKAVTAKTAAPKRKLSPARKAALAANLAKARAAKAAKRAVA